MKLVSLCKSCAKGNTMIGERVIIFFDGSVEFGVWKGKLLKQRVVWPTKQVALYVSITDDNIDFDGKELMLITSELVIDRFEWIN